MRTGQKKAGPKRAGKSNREASRLGDVKSASEDTDSPDGTGLGNAAAQHHLIGNISIGIRRKMANSVDLICG